MNSHTWKKVLVIPSNQESLDNLNSRIASYAKNYSVQLFFNGYDEWNTEDGNTCIWLDHEFEGQKCGAGSTKEDASSGGRDRMLVDFSKEMRTHFESNFFKSKTVLID